MGKKSFIGIKQIWYTKPLVAEPTQDTLKTLIQSATEVENVHEGTWGYSQDDPTVTEYINELTGKPYYRDKESAGNKTITFTLGEYDYEDKAALQGGEVIKAAGSTVVGWKSSGSLENIYKAVIAKTKTGRYVIFSNAIIVGKTDTQQKALGLGISAVALESETEGIADEYWFDAPAESGS